MKVRRARELAGYDSQRAFAEAAGLSEKSVADVERGDARPGKSTLWKVEAALGWPESGMLRYLETGRQEDLDALRVETVDDDQSLTTRERLLQRLEEIDRRYGELAEEFLALNTEREQIRRELSGDHGERYAL